MRKIEEIQPSKIVSAYGGVGSIIETVSNGSLLVRPYTDWRCLKSSSENNSNEITDVRLLQYLQKRVRSIKNLQKRVPEIKTIRRLPKIDLGDSNQAYSPDGNTLGRTISSEYFPAWFYCPKCRLLNEYDKWCELWKGKFPTQAQRFTKNPAACYFCSKGVGSKVQPVNLEQIRYVMASPSGELRDIPFREIAGYKEEGKSIESVISLSSGQSQRPLKWMQLPNSTGDDFLNLSVEGVGNLSMTQLQTPYIVFKGEVYKIFMRNQNNLYYPDRISSIYIPLLLEEGTIQTIQEEEEEGRSPEQIVKSLDRYKNFRLNVADVRYVLENHRFPFEHQEYLFITNEGFYSESSTEHTKSDRDFRAHRYLGLEIPYISKVYAIDRLKETSVVLEYTRLSPKGKTILWWDNEKQQECEIEPKPKRTYDEEGHLPEFIPGIERYGEGLFFELDTKRIDYSGDELKTFAHTLSHIVMRELEFSCGYTLASLQERIYVLDDERVGILIYTVAAAYGGLTSLCTTDHIEDRNDHAIAPIVSIVKRGIERAKMCVNDPICEEHCYACLDIPEISCCDWNNNLNRKLLV